MTDYTLIRAKRRTMSLQLDRDGRAVVRAPYGVKKEFIDRFVAEHEDWLTRAREKQQARRVKYAIIKYYYSKLDCTLAGGTRL